MEKIDIKKYAVPLEKLRWICPEEFFQFECTLDIEPLKEFIGKARALDSINFGLAIERPGFNLFLTGLTGTGKATTIKSCLQRFISGKKEKGVTYQLYDWCGESVPASPITVFEAPNSEVLWARLQQECRDGGSGCDAITIPHNTNQSTGLAFKPIAAEPVPEFPYFADRPLTAEDARVHASFEPVVEVMQTKGASECRISMLSDGGVPYLGSDELCDFESQDTNNNLVAPVPNKPNPRLSFVREGLKEGLVQEEALGVNPFKLGMVGSTDTHNATHGQTSDENFAVTGNHGITDGILFRSMGVSAAAEQQNAGGLAVGAERNPMARAPAPHSAMLRPASRSRASSSRQRRTAPAKRSATPVSSASRAATAAGSGRWRRRTCPAGLASR